MMARAKVCCLLKGWRSKLDGISRFYALCRYHCSVKYRNIYNKANSFGVTFTHLQSLGAKHVDVANVGFWGGLHVVFSLLGGSHGARARCRTVLLHSDWVIVGDLECVYLTYFINFHCIFLFIDDLVSPTSKLLNHMNVVVSLCFLHVLRVLRWI